MNMQNEMISFQELLIYSNLDNENILNREELMERVTFFDKQSFIFYKMLLFIKYKLESINFDVYGEKLQYSDLVYFYLGKNQNSSYQEYFISPLPNDKDVLNKYAKLHVSHYYDDLCQLMDMIYLYYQAISNKTDCYLEQNKLVKVKQLYEKYSH